MIDKKKYNDEIQESLKQGEKITTKEIFKEHGEKPILTWIGSREIVKTDGEILPVMEFKEYPDNIYFAGVMGRKLIKMLLRDYGSYEGVNEELKDGKTRVQFEWGENYKGDRMVMITLV